MMTTVFLFQDFSPPQVCPKLTHQLIENMYAFKNAGTAELINADNFVEKQNLFVVSDLMLITLVKYLKVPMTKNTRLEKH